MIIPHENFYKNYKLYVVFTPLNLFHNFFQILHLWIVFSLHETTEVTKFWIGKKKSY